MSTYKNQKITLFVALLLAATVLSGPSWAQLTPPGNPGGGGGSSGLGGGAGSGSGTGSGGGSGSGEAPYCELAIGTSPGCSNTVASGGLCATEIYVVAVLPLGADVDFAGYEEPSANHASYYCTDFGGYGEQLATGANLQANFATDAAIINAATVTANGVTVHCSDYGSDLMSTMSNAAQCLTPGGAR